MNRLDKKCFITMACAHGLLVIILFVGPAFFMAPEKPEKNQLITLFLIPTDKPSNGGNPNVKSAPQAPPPLPSAPPAQPIREPQPPEVHPEPVRTPPRQKAPDVVKTEKPDLKSDEPIIKPQKHRVVLDKEALTLTTTKLSTTKPRTNRTPNQNTEESQEEKDRQQLAQRIGQTIKSLDNKMSGATAVEMPGPGGKGAFAANYRDLVASKYTIAWNPPATLDDDTANVITSVTISRDGRVLRSRITKPSGNPTMDRSIQNTLDNVSFIEPFPADSNDQERTFTIKFNLQAKRNAG